MFKKIFVFSVIYLSIFTFKFLREIQVISKRIYKKRFNTWKYYQILIQQLTQKQFDQKNQKNNQFQKMRFASILLLILVVFSCICNAHVFDDDSNDPGYDRSKLKCSYSEPGCKCFKLVPKTKERKAHLIYVCDFND
ncbi:transmembrane protein, putative (macronuclear) [Tetrahymena thermophila SB210]|uniref:Transmembrane protein, putative n=1 Tax=Tetrahymena thermophila (strain SB210) TaxID=312017 RepID=I7MIT4_TETTS|nr:transmembrane protein, putative [Tetrahymena thermophila SB210]EAR94931.2 transmembrane protein, putative [Tetrahymena thermophila SB210]|eukprot:XP_001015176.2 transmembrane protein, putative [Tetrahymena thermophila SB210]